MRTTDVFATPCWNFVGGDRAIEGILMRLPRGAGLVLRNRVANVLATAAGLRDLGPAGRFTTRVPRNALYEPGLALDGAVPAEGFYPALLRRLYGVETLGPDAPGGAMDEAVLVAAGYTEAHEAEAARLTAWLAANPDVRLVLLCGPGEALAPSLRPAAVTAWSVQRWAGVSAFGRPTVEEAVAEARPARVLVASPDAAVAAHTAIGAVDWRLRAGETGGVAVLSFGAAREPVGATWLDAVLAHLEGDLGVVDTQADPSVAPTREAVAIDLA